MLIGQRSVVNRLKQISIVTVIYGQKKNNSMYVCVYLHYAKHIILRHASPIYVYMGVYLGKGTYWQFFMS